MHKWYDEEYEFTVEVTGFPARGQDRALLPKRRADRGYLSLYLRLSVNGQGYGICSKTMMMLYPIMEAVRSGGDLTNIGGENKYSKTIVCPDGCVMFRFTAKPTGNENFYKGKYFMSFPQTPNGSAAFI